MRDVGAMSRGRAASVASLADAAHRLVAAAIASSNRLSAIRAKNRFWRAAMRRDAVNRENFFIAKNRDSESARGAFRRHRRVASSVECAMIVGCVNDENACSAGISCDIDNRKPRVSAPYSHRRADARRCCRSARATRARSRRVNTSLSGTLFFSMCWCIRDVVHFDSRVHAAIKPSHYIRRATWPRKRRRRRRRRAQ